MRKSFVMRALLVFVVIALSLILMQAGSVSSVQSVNLVGSAGYFEVAGVAHINQSPYTCMVGSYCYVNFTSFFAMPVPVTMSVDASRLDLQEFQQLVNVTRSVSVNNFSAISWGNGTVELLAVNFTNVLQNTTEWVDVGGREFSYSGKTWRGLTLDFRNKGLAQYRMKLHPKSYGGLIEYSILGNASGLYAEFDPLLNATAFNATSQLDTNTSVADFAPFVDGKWLMGAGNRSNITGFDSWGDLNYNANPDWKAYLKPSGVDPCLFQVSAARGNLSLTTDDIGGYDCTIEAIRDVNVSVPKEDGIIISWWQQKDSTATGHEDGVCFVADSSITNVTSGRCNGGNDLLFVESFGAGHYVYGKGGAGATTFGTATTAVEYVNVWMNWSHFSACFSDSCSGLKAFSSTTQAQNGYIGLFIYDNAGATRTASFFNISVANATQFGQPFNFTPARFETILLNSTAIIDKVKITNTTYKTVGAQASFYVMDANHLNQQGVSEGADTDVTDFTGLIVNATFIPPGINLTSELYSVMVEWFAPLPAVLPSVNVSIINRTSSNATAVLASEHVWSNANYSHASNLPEENGTFKWFTNNTNQSWGGGNRTAEMVALIYKGAVGYWHLDSVNGSNVTFDSSGKGNNGNLLGFNQSNATTAGIILNGLQFDGKQDRVIVQDINFNWSASNFTAVLWANMFSPAGAVGGLISNRDGSGPWWTLGWYTAGEIQVELGNGSTQTYLNSRIYPANKGWQHYALTKSGLTWTLYYNGVLNKTITTAATYANIGAQTADLAIGRWSGDTQIWNGTIDEAAVYNRSLSASEIKQLYLRTWYDVSPEVLLAHMDNASNNLVNATLMGSHQPAATLVGGVNCTAEVAGVYGQACKFDGVNDYINVSRNPILNFGKGDYSVEFWLNWTGSSGVPNAIMGKRETGNWWRAYITDIGVLTIEQENNNADLEMTPQINKWYHVAVVRNVAAGTSYLYINGIQNDTATATGLDVSNNGDFLIGKFATTFFNGTIDEVRLSRKALTAQEINLSFSKGRAFFQNEYLLNSSNYVAGDTLKLEYVPRDSAGAVGVVLNSSGLSVHALKIADESEGDVAIEAGINSSLPSATKYSEQQAYVRNLSNNHTLGRFDWVASFGGQRWLINYITAGEGYVSAPNLTTAVYVLEIADKTSAQITDEVSRFINSTKS